MLRSTPTRPIGNRLVLAGLVLLGVSLGVLHNRAIARGDPSPVTTVVRTVTMPLVAAVTGVSCWISGRWSVLVGAEQAVRENRELRDENARLRAEVTRLHEMGILAQRLQRTLGFEAPAPRGRIVARVVALMPTIGFHTLVISRGSRDGVRAKSVVVAPGGVVGHVFDVAPASAVVLLLTDSSSAIGARVQRPESRATGICRGNGTDLLRMDYVARDADVRRGDIILSSGLGGERGVFPKGLPIGIVEDARLDVSGALKRVTVRPAVRFDRLEEVTVLR